MAPPKSLGCPFTPLLLTNTCEARRKFCYLDPEFWRRIFQWLVNYAPDLYADAFNLIIFGFKT